MLRTIMARSTLDTAKDKADTDTVVVRTLDDKLQDLLAAIEREQVPDRLLSLAHQLQAELVRRKQRRNPN